MCTRGNVDYDAERISIDLFYPNPWHREYGDWDCYQYKEKEGNVIGEGCYECGNKVIETIGLSVD